MGLLRPGSSAERHFFLATSSRQGFFFIALLPGGHFLSWVTKKGSKEVTGNRFRLVKSRSFSPAFSSQNTTFPGLPGLPRFREFACSLLFAIGPEPAELYRVIPARFECRAASGPPPGVASARPVLQTGVSPVCLGSQPAESAMNEEKLRASAAGGCGPT